ncbi:MAG: UDP-N-acetylmuramoyl-L-alanine--D-glutamate ligase [Sphingopyxis sp.]|nr:UDP-N-acetylmuramoyl-L-alanine--D-glutamate ligase [Sphingopyxis sp.]
MTDAGGPVFPLGPTFAGRRYAVLGLARSGMATVAALVAAGARVTAWDDRAEARDAAAALGAVIADPLTIDLSGMAGVVVSPGVPLNRHPIAQHAASCGVPVIGDIELFALARAHLPPHKVIGITGTNGKSTTTALAHHILKSAGVPTAMGGNIGLPILAQRPLPTGGVYVLELSSYQIDLTFSLDCDVAVLLNITPDHLDRYDGFDAYRAAKLRLFAMQSAPHAGIMAGAASDAQVKAALYHAASGPTRWVVPADDDAWAKVGQPSWPALQGPHNAENVWAAVNAVVEIGVEREAALACLPSYPGLPHRMERVADIDGILYINDSKATNAEAAAPALAAYPPAPKPRIHWIVGGKAKGEGLGDCEQWLAHIAHAYLIGEAAPMFARALGGRVPVSDCGTLREAVVAASAQARAGDVVLLSPACASFDQFRDFEARGDAFRAAVQMIMTGQQGPEARV